MDTAPLDRREQAQEDTGIVDALLLGNFRHSNPLVGKCLRTFIL